MIEERWRQVDKIFHDALEKEVGDRGAFLDIACAGDASLRKELDSLLRSHGKAAGFLDSPAGEQMDASISLRVSDPLTGRTFGRYELRSLLGSGGMGDVYRARDSELKRDIAIKVLPDAFSRDAERLSRFRREAEVLASLSHPNIAAIYDFETLGDSRCLVLELVEGETLAERLANGPIPLDEALRLAKQIADALEAAHDKGVIHRDLKPANIKITPDGTAKVLDFGMAKVRGDEDAGSVESSNSRDTIATAPGMVVGTAAYMSPEQARGKSVDRRTDIWAFGCVLYEMLTGRTVFGRDTATDTLAAILERDPDWSALPATTPATIQRLLFRCLDKNLRGRLRDIADARLELEDVLNGAIPGSQGAMAYRGRNVPRWSIAVSIVALVALVAVGALLWNVPKNSTAGPAPQVSRTLILGVNDPPVLRRGGLRSVALTPDATHVFYIGGVNTLFDRPLNRLEARSILSGAAPLTFIFADDHNLGYLEGTHLKKVGLTGGPSTTILEGPRPGLVGATFAPEDTIIFADEDSKTGLQRVSGNGGTVKTLTWPNRDRGELDHVWPEMVPGGNTVLFTITFDTGKPGDSQLAAFDLATGKVTNLLVGGSHAHYVPGHLLYTSDGKLQAIGFDAVGLKTIGTPFTVASVRIRKPLVDASGDFDVADNGTLVYLEAPAPGASEQEMQAERTVVWVSRDDKEEPLGTPPDRYMQPRVSLDATRVALPSNGKNGNIRIWDFALRNFINQVTFTPGAESSPIWLDGTHLAFFYPTGFGSTLLKQHVDGRSVAVGLASGNPSGMTPDGKSLLFSKSSKELWRLPLDNPSQAEPLLRDPASTVRNAVVSPDARWLAFESDKEKRGEFQIYVANYSDVGARQWKISLSGGIMPLWNPSSSPDNPELFYVAPDGAIQSVHLGTGGMRLGDAVTVVVAGPYVTLAESTPRTYDVSPNGQQFLVVKRSPKEQGATPPQIILYQNWMKDPNHTMP